MVTKTNATVTFSVSKILYTPETYFVNFNGVERDTNEKSSKPVIGSANINAVNLTYSITLTDLEENTTYNYTVTAMNCIGNTTTTVMSFKTLFDGEIYLANKL